MQIKIIDIFPGYDIYFRVPIKIQVKKLIKLFFLLCRERRKIFLNNTHYSLDNLETTEPSRSNERIVP